jgi:hypothetical protein
LKGEDFGKKGKGKRSCLPEIFTIVNERLSIIHQRRKNNGLADSIYELTRTGQNRSQRRCKKPLDLTPRFL